MFAASELPSAKTPCRDILFTAFIRAETPQNAAIPSRPCVAATGGRGDVGAGGHQPAARQTKLLRPWPTRKASAATPSPIARPPSPPGRRQRVVLGNLVTASSPTFFPIAVPTSVELR